MNQEPNSQVKTILIFACAVVALGLLVAATQVEMPLQAILIAVAFSEITFMILIALGKILPNKRK